MLFLNLKKIRPYTDIFVLSVFILLVCLFVYSCVKESKEKQIESQLEELRYQNQISEMSQQIDELQEENDAISNENTDLSIENLELETKTYQITKEKIELSNTLAKIANKQNSLLETASLASQLGLSKPDELGYTPVFRFTLNPVDKYTQEEALINLSRGSYQYEREIVDFNVKDVNSWKNLGDWKFTGYTATPEECDSTPSFTANDSLVTPGFTLAVDPKYWPYGTIFYIDGLGFAIAADCGRDIKGKNRGDFLVADKTFSAHLTGHRNVWLVYLPTPSVQ